MQSWKINVQSSDSPPGRPPCKFWSVQPIVPSSNSAGASLQLLQLRPLQIFSPAGSAHRPRWPGSPDPGLVANANVVLAQPFYQNKTKYNTSLLCDRFNLFVMKYDWKCSAAGTNLWGKTKPVVNVTTWRCVRHPVSFITAVIDAGTRSLSPAVPFFLMKKFHLDFISFSISRAETWKLKL